MQLQQRMTAQPLLMKVQPRSPRAACCSSACVFITIGPYQATGSRSGFPETSRNQNSFFAGLDRYLVATVEGNERAIAMLRLRASTRATVEPKSGVVFVEPRAPTSEPRPKAR